MEIYEHDGKTESVMPPDLTQADVTGNDAADGTAIAEPPKPTPLPSPKTARLLYCAFSEMRPSPESKYAPMSLFGYIVMLAATSVPVAGFIAAAIVACVSKKLARKRLALAVVLIRTFLIVVSGAALAVAMLVFDLDLSGIMSSLAVN